MNKKIALLSLISFLCLHAILAQGIEFVHSLEEAKKLAKEKDRIIFVDAYTTWCGPCKKLSKQVFPQKQAGELFNNNFINLKLDMEKGEGIDFARKFGIRSYPTLLFITPDDELVFKSIGFKKLEAFLELGRTALSKQDFTSKYAKEYEKGNRDYDLVYNYVKALNRSGKSSLKVANDYLKTQNKLSTPENLKFILEAASQADSKIFEYLIRYMEPIRQIATQELIDKRIISACANTAKKALRFESPELLDEAIQKAYQFTPRLAEKQVVDWIGAYYQRMEDPKGFVQQINRIPGAIDHDQKYTLIEMTLNHFFEDKQAQKLAEKVGKELLKHRNKNWKYHYILAKVYQKSNRYKKAEKHGKLALRYLDKTDAHKHKMLTRFLDNITES